jgi:hypothetical protein
MGLRIKADPHLQYKNAERLDMTSGMSDNISSISLGVAILASRRGME